MKSVANILLWLALSTTSFSQHEQLRATVETIASTFNFQGDTLAGAIYFMLNKNGKQYCVTAAHLFKTAHKSGYSSFTNGYSKSIRAT